MKVNREACVRVRGREEFRPSTPAGSLNASFIWADTSEGHDFWSMLQMIIALVTRKPDAWRMSDLLLTVGRMIPAEPKSEPTMQPEGTKKGRIITLPKA